MTGLQRLSIEMSHARDLRGGAVGQHDCCAPPERLIPGTLPTQIACGRERAASPAAERRFRIAGGTIEFRWRTCYRADCRVKQRGAHVKRIGLLVAALAVATILCSSAFAEERKAKFVVDNIT
jgi:hypothetical protein